MVSSAGTTKERVSIARQRRRARGAAMYLIVFWVFFWTKVWTCETSVGGWRYLWSGCKGASGDSWVTPSVGETVWLPTKRSKES